MEKAQAVFMLWVELEAVDVFLVRFFLCLSLHCMRFHSSFIDLGWNQSYEVNFV